MSNVVIYYSFLVYFTYIGYYSILQNDKNSTGTLYRYLYILINYMLIHLVQLTYSNEITFLTIYNIFQYFISIGLFYCMCVSFYLYINKQVSKLRFVLEKVSFPILLIRRDTYFGIQYSFLIFFYVL